MSEPTKIILTDVSPAGHTVPVHVIEAVDRLNALWVVDKTIQVRLVIENQMFNVLDLVNTILDAGTWGRVVPVYEHPDSENPDHTKLIGFGVADPSGTLVLSPSREPVSDGVIDV